jgi:hypothetical protein
MQIEVFMLVSVLTYMSGHNYFVLYRIYSYYSVLIVCPSLLAFIIDSTPSIKEMKMIG